MIPVPLGRKVRIVQSVNHTRYDITHIEQFGLRQTSVEENLLCYKLILTFYQYLTKTQKDPQQTLRSYEHLLKYNNQASIEPDSGTIVLPSSQGQSGYTFSPRGLLIGLVGGKGQV